MEIINKIKTKGAKYIFFWTMYMCFSVLIIYVYNGNRLLMLLGNPFTVIIYIIISLQYENKRFANFIRTYHKKEWEKAKTWGIGNRIKWSWAFISQDNLDSDIKDIKKAYRRTILIIYILGILTFPLFGVIGIILDTYLN